MEKLSPKEAGLERIRDLDVLSTIPEMLALQVEKRPDAVGWKSWDPVKKSWRDWTFRQGYDEVQRWRHAFAGLGLTRGTRVAMLLPNCIEAVLFDQAALANAGAASCYRYAKIVGLHSQRLRRRSFGHQQEAQVAFGA